MTTGVQVSICLTTFNRASVLPKTLDSLLAQSFCDFELVISDDCSTDDTESICRKYAAQDSRIKYYRNQRNLKMPGNLNAAIQRSRGEYIANLHDGDVYRPDLIEKWKSALDLVPSASFVFNDYEWVREDGKRILYRLPFAPYVDGKEIALHYFKTFTSCVWGTVMTRRSEYQRVGLFNSKFGFISDVDMWLRLARDRVVAYVAEPLITLTPREKNHPFAFVHWQHVFWQLGIYVENIALYGSCLPEASQFRLAYPSRRRSLFLKSMAICIKHKRFDRVREGFAIWRDADDPWLKLLGRMLGNPKDVPEWYNAEYYWRMARLSR